MMPTDRWYVKATPHTTNPASSARTSENTPPPGRGGPLWPPVHPRDQLVVRPIHPGDELLCHFDRDTRSNRTHPAGGTHPPVTLIGLTTPLCHVGSATFVPTPPAVILSRSEGSLVGRNPLQAGNLQGPGVVEITTGIERSLLPRPDLGTSP